MSDRLTKIQQAYQGDKNQIAKAQIKSANKNEKIVQGYSDDERTGNRAGFVYNEILNGVGDIAAGLGDFGTQLFTRGIAGGGNPYQTNVVRTPEEEINANEAIKNYRENIAPEVRGYLKDKIGTEVDKVLENKYRDETLTGAVGGLARTLPAIAATAVSGGAGGGALFLQSYDNALATLDQSQAGKELDDATKTVYATGIGIVTSALEKFGLDRIMKGETGVISKLLTDRALKNAVKETGGKVTGDIFTKFLNKEIVDLSGKFAKGGAKVLDGYLTEAFTGGAQEVATIAGENLLNSSTGKPVFDMEDTNSWSGFIKRVGKAANAEGIGGGLLGTIGALGGFKRTDIQQKEQQIKDIDASLENENISDVAKEVLVQNKVKLQSELQDVADRVDENYSKLDTQQKSVVDAIVEQKAKIEETILDPNITPEVKTSLEEQSVSLDKELSEIKPLEATKPKGGEEYFDVYESAVKEAKSSEEAFKEVTKDSGVLSDTFNRKYNPDGNLSLQETFDKFYSEIKPSEEVKPVEKPITPIEEVNPVEVVKTIENEPIQTDNKIKDVQEANVEETAQVAEKILIKAEDDLKTLKQVANKTAKYEASIKRLTEAKNDKSISEQEFNDLKDRFDDVMADSKPVEKVEIKQDDAKQYALSEIKKGNINWDGDRLTPRPELGLEWADIRKGQADLLAGKDTPASKRLVEAINKAKEEGGYNFIQGSGKLVNRIFVPLEEKMPEKLTSEEIKEIGAREAELATEYDSWFENLTPEEKQEEINSIENARETETNPGRESQENVPDQKDAGDNTTKTKEDSERLKEAKEKLQEAKNNFKKAVSQLSSGGAFNAIGEFTKLIKAYAEVGIVKLSEVISDMRSDHGDEFVDKHLEAIEEAHKQVNSKEETATEKTETTTENSFTSKLKEGIEGDTIAESMNNLNREAWTAPTEAEQEYFAADMQTAFRHGVEIVDSAKKEFGDDYVEKMLDYIGNSKINPDSESLAIISLENDLEYRITQEPENAPKLENQLRKVRKVSTEMQRQKARGIAFGRLRQIGRVGWEVARVTEDFFSTKDSAKRTNIKKTVEASGEDLNRLADEDAQYEGSVEDLTDIDVNEKQENKSKAKSIANYLRSLKSNKSYMKSMGSGNIGGVLDFFRDATLETIATTVEAGGSIAEGIRKAAAHIQNQQKKRKQKVTDRIQLEKSIKDDLFGSKKSKETATPQELLEQAKERLKERIEEKKQQIADKKVELDVRGVKFDKDAEYKKLARELKHLDEQSKQFLTEDSKTLLDDRKKAAISTKLENEIASLDEQIADGKKKAKADNKNPLTSPLIQDLEARKKVKQELLNDIDPNIKEVVKSALIEGGYGRDITVNTKNGKEKRTILDWKELSSAQDISEAVDKSLGKQGYTQVQKDRMKVAIQGELNDLRANFIDKNSQSELDRRNTPTDGGSKTSAKRLAELYNYGLFDKNPDEYDYLVNSALGMSVKDQQLFFEAKGLAKSLSELYQKIDPSTGKKYSEFSLAEPVSQINKQIERVLTMAVRNKATTMFNAMNLTQAFIGGNLRNKLTGIRNITENVLSGYTERKIGELHDFFTNGLKSGKYTTKAQRKSLAEDAKKLFEDTVFNAGGEYGGTGSPFVSKNLIMDAINNWVDKGDNESLKKVGHAVTSVMTLRLGLEGTDSFNKIILTEKQFARNMIKVLTDANNPNKMSKEDAMAYVSEKMTGQSKKDATEKAITIINEINESAGKEILKETAENVNRIANNLIKDALVSGQKISPEMIKASFNAAYKSAGRGIGHEANNFGTQFLGWANQRMDGEMKKAIKEEQWGKAAAIQALQIINKNFINPFVGGGLNWTVLGLQKTGVPIQYLVDYNAYERPKAIDVTTPEGIKELERTLTIKANHNRDHARVIIGALVTATLLSAIKSGLSNDDEKKARRYLKAHPFLEKSFTKLAPPAVVGYMAYGDKKGKFMTFIKALVNQRTNMYDQKEMAFKAVAGTLPKGNDAAGVAGDILGDKFGVPYFPVPFMQDLKEIKAEARGEKIGDKSDYKTKGFWNGYFKRGIVNLIGERPKAQKK